nr:TRAP transporter large permease subunit [Alkalibacter rhizosphaerae]
MTALILFVSFIILIFFGLPVAFSLGASSLIYLLLEDIPLTIMAQKMYAGLDSFTLVSIPGFILAGNLMNTGGITRRIIDFANAILGHIRGDCPWPTSVRPCSSPGSPVPLWRIRPALAPC